MSDQIESLAKKGTLSKMENLSPLVLQQLRQLAFRVNEGDIRLRAAHRAQLKVSEEMSIVRFKLAPLIEERRSYERYGEAGAEEVAKLNESIYPMEKRASVLKGQKDAIVADKEEVNASVAPERELLGRILSYMRVKNLVDFFPDLPGDDSAVIVR